MKRQNSGRVSRQDSKLARTASVPTARSVGKNLVAVVIPGTLRIRVFDSRKSVGGGTNATGDGGQYMTRINSLNMTATNAFGRMDSLPLPRGQGGGALQQGGSFSRLNSIPMPQQGGPAAGGARGGAGAQGGKGGKGGGGGGPQRTSNMDIMGGQPIYRINTEVLEAQARAYGQTLSQPQPRQAAPAPARASVGRAGGSGGAGGAGGALGAVDAAVDGAPMTRQNSLFMPGQVRHNIWCWLLRVRCRARRNAC